LVALAAALVPLGGCQGEPGATEPDPTPAFLRDTSRNGVVHCTPGGVALGMDLSFPGAEVGPGAPVALHLHGGGWVAGTRSSGPWFTQVRDGLVARGWVVASATYRLAPEHRWPAQAEDVACALRHLAGEAERYGLDPTRVSAWGHSAGGHLASLLGVAGRGSGFPPGEGVPHRLRGVVTIGAPTDLTAPGGVNLLLAPALLATFGTADPGSPLLRDASPVRWVSPGDPPHLVVHGARDPVVSPTQATLLHQALLGADVEARLLLVENGDHNLQPTGGPIRPSADAVLREILEFMERVSGGTPAPLPPEPDSRE